MKVGNIIQGFINDLLDENSELAKTRLLICERCEMYKETIALGAICNPSKYIDPESFHVVDKPTKGYKRGCSCILSKKTRVKNEHCIVNRW